ncbi:MAG TPA: hypothetical protein VGX03_29660 [Candidatus Binatia bacterium]|jgi:predicted metal-dependent enzyme (double-stranded beta helix superfamily)|nr:hypothetical protein [Candidatus Binatia bacterium]
MYDLPSPIGTKVAQSHVIRASANALGLPLFEGHSSPPAPEPVSITWEEFVHDLGTRAESLVGRRLDEETYVTQVAEQLQRVDPLTIPPWNALPRHQLWEVSEFWLAEGTGFPPHDHRLYNGVIFVLEGRIHIRSYDIVNSERTPPAGRRVCIRETGNRVLVAGECSTLTTTRDNIHAVRGGPGGCRLLDIFTWLGLFPQSVYLEVEEHPIESGPNIYWASFID